MTDLYAFSKPGDPAKSILIFNVHPSMAVNPVSPTTREPFAPGALYEIKIDTNGDAIADLCYSVRFAVVEGWEADCDPPPCRGTQQPEYATRATSSSSKHRSQSGGNPGSRTSATVGLFFGWRSDPFFFDANGLFNKMQFTGDDFFADRNVCSIVLELPNSALANKEVGIWARTLERNGRRLDPGRPRWKTLASGFPPRRGERSLSQRPASG